MRFEVGQVDSSPKLTPAEKCEFAGSVFWLLMDFCWFKEWQLASFILIPPTILAHLLIIALGEKEFAYIAVYAALNSWVMANALWVIGDLNGVRPFVIAADIFFKLAMVLTCLVVFLSFKNRRLKMVLRLFRRFRIRL